MDDPLQRLVRELQNESCPPVVMDRVARRITHEKRGQRVRRHAWAWAIAFLVPLVALGIWYTEADRVAQRKAAELEAKARMDRARVAKQTAGALGYIGQVLLEAAAQLQDSILKEAIPPLRDSLEKIKTEITKKI